MYTDDRTGPALDKIWSTAGSAPPRPSTLRCPWCGHVGVLVSRSTDLTNGEMQSEHMRFAGIRHCPNPECHGLIFVVVDHHGTVLDSSPRPRVEIDRSDIPDAVLDRLEEAVACHGAGADRAAGVMLRATIEAACDDREVAAGDVGERVKGLASSSGVRDEYVSALGALDLLDAMTVGALVDDLGDADHDSMSDAIEVVKAVLNLVYQHHEITDILERHRRR